MRSIRFGSTYYIGKWFSDGKNRRDSPKTLKKIDFLVDKKCSFVSFFFLLHERIVFIVWLHVSPPNGIFRSKNDVPCVMVYYMVFGLFLLFCLVYLHGD